MVLMSGFLKAYKHNFKVAFLTAFARQSSSVTTLNEYRNHPIYPEIIDPSPKGDQKRTIEARYEKIKKLSLVEEKLFAINLPKYYGWETLIMEDGVVPYNFLPFVCHITRTKLFQVDTTTFHNVQFVSLEECKEQAKKISQLLQEAILFEIKGRKRKIVDETGRQLSQCEIDTETCSSVIQQINRVLVSSLSASYPHLLDSMSDYDARVEGFWNIKEGEEEKWVQYIGRPCAQVRSTLPLGVLNTDALDNMVGEEETKSEYDQDCDPCTSYGLSRHRRHGTTIPGFWPGDTHEFGLLSLLRRGDTTQSQATPSELDDCQATLASFSWLLGQASYQGFSPYNELSYPLTTQTILTDGRVFSFYLYQMNTVVMTMENNPRHNLCLGLPSAPLYSVIENNELVGWNEEVLENLVSCYINRPQKRLGEEMKPYLGRDKWLVAHIDDDERRVFLHNQFRHMYSNRPRHKRGYEIYDWERIYKIEFETRPMEARMRPFERDHNPTEDRRYCDHKPKYIPRSQRDLKECRKKGWRSKFNRTYYPDF